jgi:hypothetical protein
MSNYFGKQPSSRPIKYQALAYGGNATSVPSTNFTPETFQIRVVAEVQGWLQIGDGTSGCRHGGIIEHEDQPSRRRRVFCGHARPNVRVQ